MLLCCLMQETLYKIKCIIIPTPLLQRIRHIMLPSAYWLLSLFKPVSKHYTAHLSQKKSSLSDLLFKEVYNCTHLVLLQEATTPPLLTRNVL